MFWGTVPAPPGVFLPVSLNRNCPVCPGSLPSRSFTGHGNQQLYGNHECGHCAERLLRHALVLGPT